MLLSSKNMPIAILKKVKYFTWFCKYIILSRLVVRVEVEAVVVEDSLEIARFVVMNAKFERENPPKPCRF